MFRPAPTGKTMTSPGRRAATSTQPPEPGAVSVVMNSDSPPSIERLRPFIRPPWTLASISTPPDVAYIAPDSARIDSPPASVQRATAKLGLWRMVTSMRATLL